MAGLRVFISCPFRDRHVREDLERFIRGLGHEPVLSERGHVVYDRTRPVEQSCYCEIVSCDILVHIVGGRYGSPSSEGDYSISQMELKTAHRLRKQVYIFVDSHVAAEYGTWQENQENKEFQPRYVDDVRVYRFLDEVYSTWATAPVFEFGSVNELVECLREQLARLFQRLLRQESDSARDEVASHL